jgi:hypothetical protein
MLNILSWGKNRACQLDLSLSTLKKHFLNYKEQDITVIYKASNEEYDKGYELVKQYHPDIKWIKETNFKTDTLEVFNNTSKEYVSFFVDDDVFLNNFSTADKEFQQFREDTLIATLSLRLSRNISHCYPLNCPQNYPGQNRYFWRNQQSDFSYPWTVACCSIFRKSDIQNHINNIDFNGPNSLESQFCNFMFPGQDFMLCYDTSKAYCAANNKVQNYNENRHENTHSLEDLNKQFLLGRRLNPNIYANRVIPSCHGPIEYIWTV